MSHTDKDLPYWVRLNNEGTLTDHNHLRLGKPITHYRYVRDENGHRIKVMEPVYLSALEIVRRSKSYNHRFLAGVLEEAESYCSWPNLYWNARQYNPDKMILVRIREYYQKETVVTDHVYDFCTEGMKLPDDTWRWWSKLPCTPEIPAGKRRLMYTRGSSEARAGYSKMRNGQSRTTKRNLLTEVVKGYNSGTDMDDYEELLPLTNQHRHSMAWDLY